MLPQSLPARISASAFESTPAPAVSGHGLGNIAIVADQNDDGSDELLFLTGDSTPLEYVQHLSTGETTHVSIHDGHAGVIYDVLDLGDINGDGDRDIGLVHGRFHTRLYVHFGPFGDETRATNAPDWSFTIPSPLNRFDSYRLEPLEVFRVQLDDGEMLLMCTADAADTPRQNPVCFGIPLPVEAGEEFDTSVPYIGSTIVGPDLYFVDEVWDPESQFGYTGKNALLCDLDADGDLDLFGGQASSMAVVQDFVDQLVWMGEVTLAPSSVHTTATGSSTTTWDGFRLIDQRCADLTGDGIPDLLLNGATNLDYRRYHQEIVLLEGPITDLSIAFEQRQLLAEGGLGVGVGFEVIGDIDGDGASDFTHHAPGGEQRSLLLYLSGRGFDDPIAIIADDENGVDSLFGASVSKGGDLDGDGLLDFAVAAPGAEKIYLITGKRLRELAQGGQPADVVP